MIMDMVSKKWMPQLSTLITLSKKLETGRASTSMVQDVVGRILRSNVANQSSGECICSRCDDDFYSTMG